MKQLFIAIAVVATAATLTACGGNNLDSLRAKEWSLEKIIYADSNYSVDAPAGVYIVFADSNRVSGNGGCNQFFGPYQTEGEDQITLDKLASTRMFCFDEGFEGQFLSLLSQVRTFQASEHEMTLNGENNSFTLLFSERIVLPEDQNADTDAQGEETPDEETAEEPDSTVTE